MTDKDVVNPADHVLDAGYESCGNLLVLIFGTMKTVAPGEVLQVIGYDTGSKADVPAWCKLTGHQLLRTEVPEDRSAPISYFIQKG